MLDTSNYKLVGVIPPCVRGYSTKCIGSVKDKPDADSKFKLSFLSNGKVALQASNGLYLSRIAYSNDPVDKLNHIQPAKNTPDFFSQFEYEYDEEGGPFENVGTIILKADNGRYMAPSDGMTIKPLATEPHKFIVCPARSTMSSESPEYYFYKW